MKKVHFDPVALINLKPSLIKGWLALFMLALLWAGMPTEANACNYFRKLDRYNKAIDRFNDLVANGAPAAQINLAAARICRLRKDIDQKFKNRTGKPTPDLPPGIDCSMMGGGGGGGGGRGGVGGGGGSPGGGPIPFNVWIRNHDSIACVVSWKIIADSANIAGFTISPDSGSVSVGPFASGPVLVPFTIDIAAAVPVGTIAAFRVELIDSCNNLPFGEEFSFFEVVATEDVQIAPLAPLVPVPDGPAPFSVGWRLTNNTSDTIVKDYGFISLPDPVNEEFLNNGTPYFILNAAPADKSNTGGMVTIPPNDFVNINWDLISTQYCDPEMLGCCAIEIDGAISCVMTPNDEATLTATCGDTWQLNGMPQGGNVDIIISHNLMTFPVSIQSAPTNVIPEILDNLAFQMIELFDFQPGFNFQPVVDENELIMMIPPGANMQFFTTDPGLQWQSVACVDTVPIFVGLSPEEFYNSLPVMMAIYPNPAGETATMDFNLKEAAFVSLECHDLAGKFVDVNFREQQYGAGDHTETLDLSHIPAGVYFFSLVADNRKVIRRLIRN